MIYTLTYRFWIQKQHTLTRLLYTMAYIHTKTDWVHIQRNLIEFKEWSGYHQYLHIDEGIHRSDKNPDRPRIVGLQTAQFQYINNRSTPRTLRGLPKIYQKGTRKQTRKHFHRGKNDELTCESIILGWFFGWNNPKPHIAQVFRQNDNREDSRKRVSCLLIHRGRLR